MKTVKVLIFLLIVLPILALVLSLCGLPALDGVAWLLNFIGGLFSKVGESCHWIQTLINNGIIK